MTDEQTTEAPVYTAPPLMGLMERAPDLHIDLPDPVNGPYFIALKDGYHMVKATHWGKVMVPVKEIPSLPEYKAASILWYPEQRLPQDLIAQVWGFFLQVFKDIGTEAMIYLTHKDGQYRVFVPPQRVTKVAVKADFKAEHLGDWQVVGTIHSHCDFNAYHSGTDNHDADGMDGLHITIGNVNSYVPSVALMISVNKIKWNMKPEDIIEDGMPKDPTPHPVWWHRYVEKDTTVTTTQYGSYNNSYNQGKGTPNPPSKAPAGRGKNKAGSRSKNGHDAGKQKNAKADKRGLKEVDIDKIESISEVFEELRGYALWGDKLTEQELDLVAQYLEAKWEDLSSDLAAIGIWAEVAASPVWNIVRQLNVAEMRKEMVDLIDKATKELADLMLDGVNDPKSTDDRDWVLETPGSNLTTADRDDIVALLGGH